RVFGHRDLSVAIGIVASKPIGQPLGKLVGRRDKLVRLFRIGRGSGLAARRTALARIAPAGLATTPTALPTAALSPPATAAGPAAPWSAPTGLLEPTFKKCCKFLAREAAIAVFI